MSDTLPDDSGHRVAALVAALKTARSALGWSQKELASASGISKVTIARMEAGMMSPRLDTLSKLQLTLERAGASFALNDPPGGFTLRVEGRALEARPPAEEKTEPGPTSIEELVLGVGGKVVARNAGQSRGKLTARTATAKISEEITP